MKNIKNIIFDMGGVLFDFQPRRIVDKYTELSQEDRDYLMNLIFIGDGWNGIDYGEYDDDTYIKILQKKAPERLHKYIAKLMRTWYIPTTPIVGTADVVRDLKSKGYKIYLLSNAGLNHAKYWHTVTGNEYFDGVVVSAFEKVWKPHPEFYNILLNRYNLNPTECLFIDDLQVNLDGAEKLGVNTLLFTDSAKLRKDLLERNVL